MLFETSILTQDITLIKKKLICLIQNTCLLLPYIIPMLFVIHTSHVIVIFLYYEQNKNLLCHSVFYLLVCYVLKWKTRYLEIKSTHNTFAHKDIYLLLVQSRVIVKKNYFSEKCKQKYFILVTFTFLKFHVIN